jgi:hypothetical protein
MLLNSSDIMYNSANIIITCIEGSKEQVSWLSLFYWNLSWIITINNVSFTIDNFKAYLIIKLAFSIYYWKSIFNFRRIKPDML